MEKGTWELQFNQELESDFRLTAFWYGLATASWQCVRNIFPSEVQKDIDELLKVEGRSSFEEIDDKLFDKVCPTPPRGYPSCVSTHSVWNCPLPQVTPKLRKNLAFVSWERSDGNGTGESAGLTGEEVGNYDKQRVQTASNGGGGNNDVSPGAAAGAIVVVAVVGVAIGALITFLAMRRSN